MQKEDLASKYFFFGLLGLAGIISLIVILPVLGSLVVGAVLAFVFYPLHDRIQKKVKHKTLAAFIIASVLVLLIVIPSVYLFNSLAQETNYLYVRAKQQIMSGDIIESRCYENNLVCMTVNNFNALLRDEDVKAYLLTLLNDLLSFITKKASEIFFSIPRLLLSIMLTLFTTFYLLVDGKKYLGLLEKLIPVKVNHQDKILKQFSDVVYALIYGSFIVAIVQGTLGAFGFWLFGVPGFVWFGLLMTLFALVPFIGTAIVWLPMSMFFILTGYLQGEPSTIWKGLGLFLYGLLFISTIDNFLKPFIIAERAKIHPLVVLIGVVGGLFLFGFVGLIIGPFVLSLFQTLLEIYERERYLGKS